MKSFRKPEIIDCSNSIHNFSTIRLHKLKIFAYSYISIREIKRYDWEDRTNHRQIVNKKPAFSRVWQSGCAEIGPRVSSPASESIIDTKETRAAAFPALLLAAACRLNDSGTIVVRWVTRMPVATITTYEPTLFSPERMRRSVVSSLLLPAAATASIYRSSTVWRTGPPPSRA